MKKIRQILLNLLNNAIKFTSKGFIKLSVSLEKEEKTVTFLIEDSGIGISTENQKNLFSFLEKDCKKNNDQRAGLGFGLVISQALAKKLCPDGNGLNVLSTVEVGSKFFFKVKLKEVGNSEVEIPWENINIHFNEHKKFKKLNSLSPKKDEIIRILLVDDDMINIMVHSQYLKKFHLAFDTAFNGKEAIGKIVENAEKKCFYSLVLMDCNMPVMDGFQATENIVDMIKKGKIPSLYVVAVTANASSAHKDRCRNCGMKFFLEKPVSIDKMKETLQQLLNIEIDDSNGE